MLLVKCLSKSVSGFVPGLLSRYGSRFLSRPVWLLWVSALFLTACQTSIKAPPVRDGWSTDPALFSSRDAWQKEMSGWKLSGKVGIRTPDIKESANLIWQVNGDKNVIRLFGPLGAGAVRLEFDAHQAVLKDQKGNEYIGSDAEALLQRVVGWPIPLTALKRWVFALPADDRAYQYVAEGDQLRALDQAGWAITYNAYKPYLAGAPTLPRKIIATAQTSDNEADEQVVVRLIVKSWSQNKVK